VRIAVAVQNADACDAIVTSLRDLGLSVAVCSSIAELQSYKPDMAFCEWPLRTSADCLIQYLQLTSSIARGTKTVVIVPGGSLALFQRARQLGATDVLFSPPDPLEVKAEIEEFSHADERPELSREKLKQILSRDLVGESLSFRKCLDEMKIAATSDANVLLTGETGTGKEMFARAIHHLSVRSREPYVAVNCASLPGELLESELFGHSRGSFTGADRDRPGRFEAVGSGTLLLDEIGDLATALQTKLLRVIEQREFQRLGENANRPFLGRLICATSMDLDVAVNQNVFRRDLFGRINQLRILLPAISERRSDIPILVRHFLAKHSGNRPVAISSSAMDVLAHSTFPMNVRQIENVIVGAVARSSPGKMILPKHLALGDSTTNQRTAEEGDYHISVPRDLSYVEAREAALQTIDGIYLMQLLEKHGGNQTLAAHEAGIDRKTFALRLIAVRGES
jgi:DNA-binding NtrC family response regulator